MRDPLDPYEKKLDQAWEDNRKAERDAWFRRQKTVNDDVQALLSQGKVEAARLRMDFEPSQGIGDVLQRRDLESQQKRSFANLVKTFWHDPTLSTDTKLAFLQGYITAERTFHEPWFELFDNEAQSVFDSSLPSEIKCKVIDGYLEAWDLK